MSISQTHLCDVRCRILPRFRLLRELDRSRDSGPLNTEPLLGHGLEEDVLYTALVERYLGLYKG